MKELLKVCSNILAIRNVQYACIFTNCYDNSPIIVIMKQNYHYNYEMLMHTICSYICIYVCMYVEPSQPKELSVLKITEAAITLSWKESNPSDVSIVGYEVQYRKSGEEFKKVEKSLTHEDLTCEVTGLLANTEYQFKVAAINKAGCGTFTDIVTQFTSESLL